MAGQTTVTMVLINKTTQDKGRTDLLEGCFLFLQFGVGDTLTDNHNLYPPSNRPHFAALAAAEQNTTVCKKPTQSPPLSQGSYNFTLALVSDIGMRGTGFVVAVTLPHHIPPPVQHVRRCKQGCSWTAPSSDHSQHLPST